MDIEHILKPTICGRNHHRMTSVDEANVTNEPFIQDSIDNAAVITTPLKQAF